jgi:hypothetical protein
MFLPVRLKQYRFTCIVLSIASTIMLSCSSQHEPMEMGNTIEAAENKREEPVTVVRAVELATKEFLKTGNKIEDFRITVESDNASNEWSISFNPRTTPRPPGGGFYARINKDTGRLFFRADD